MANTAYRYRLYPVPEQEILISKTFGCCRKVFNLMLADRKEYYKATGTSRIFTPAEYKEDYPYLKEVDSLALANEQMHLQTAFKNFFKDKRVGHPKFKSKKNDRNSYTTNLVNGNIKVLSDAVILPKVGKVKAKIHRQAPPDYVLKSMTVSREKDGTTYVSVLYEYEQDIQPAEYIDSHIGLDYKSDGLYAASDGSTADMPHFYRESESKLSKEQRRLSKKTKGSNNYYKQKHKVAKVSRHTANQRKDFLHKLSYEITNRYDLISVETLNMRGMAGSLKLGKSTLDNGYGMFLSMLAYKQERNGHYLIKVDKFYPSSQLCRCGYKNPAAKELSVRTITCPACGHTYDRDINAAINIDQEGYRLLMEQTTNPSYITRKA